MSSTTVDEVLRAADAPLARQTLEGLLRDLVRIDTTVGPDLERVRAAEASALELIAHTVERVRGSADGIERVPIDPRIERDPYYTPAHYTKTAEQPDGLDAAQTYRDRGNLVVRVPGQGRGVVGFNAHVDVVSPYLPPRLEGGVVYGRGACDDKGSCAAMLLALDLIERARAQGGHVPPADLLFEFVIDEEPGGNGSLSLSLDRAFAADALVVLEVTDLAVHPANRGAVWYRLALDGAACPDLDLTRVAAACILALEDEGATLKHESDHPLFPHRPVQTCHGLLGPWGKHPSAINDHVELAALCSAPPDEGRVRSAVDRAVAAYCARYGDKTKETDPQTGKPKVDHHYDLAVDGSVARLVVHGKAGHMGATPQCDNAITKAACILAALEAADGLAIQRFSPYPDEPSRPVASLVVEGGQGFVPTHSLPEVTDRMRQAINRGATLACERQGLPFDPSLTHTTFDKLHNEAYARDPQSPAVTAFVACVRAAGIEVPEPLLGWDVSCDARIFAREYPDSAIITFGAGRLQDAHSADEHVRLDDLAKVAKAIARFALTYAPSRE